MVLSVIAITDRVLPGMRAEQWGRIITSTSSGVVSPIPNLGISNALRLSLVGWSKTLAREVGRDGITANVILPGRIATDRIKFLDEAKAKREGRTVEELQRKARAASRSAATASQKNTAQSSHFWPASGQHTSPARSSASMAA